MTSQSAAQLRARETQVTWRKHQMHFEPSDINNHFRLTISQFQMHCIAVFRTNAHALKVKLDTTQNI